MTKHSIEILIERVASWPQEAKDEFVKSLADIESRHLDIYRLDADERAAVQRGLTEMREGRIATDEEVEALFSRYGA